MQPHWQFQYWHQQALNCSQHDLISAAITILLLASNMFRGASSYSSYTSPESWNNLWVTWCIFALAVPVHALAIWLLVQRPHTALQWRAALTCARWLVVIGMVTASTPLPVFQSSHDAYGTCWLSHMAGCLFRTGTMFCLTQPLFYRLPWRLYALMSLVNALCSNVRVTGPYCVRLMAAFGTSQPQHVDYNMINGIAAALDTLSGQGRMLTQGSSPWDAAASILGPSTAAAAAAAAAVVAQQPGTALLEPGEEQWQPTARALAAACSQQHVLQGAPALQEACRRALTGQCVAVVNTMKLGVSYFIVLVIIALEHYSKWQFVRRFQQQQVRQQQQQAAGPADALSWSAADQAGGSASSSSSSSSWRRDGALSHGALLDPIRAPTAGALLRMELLKLVVLFDVPVLVMWWGLSSVLRSQQS